MRSMVGGGQAHAAFAGRDARRDAWLAGQGVRTLRFSVEDVELRPAVVLAAIREAAAPSVAHGATPPP